MSGKDINDRIKETDDFWDIDVMLPDKSPHRAFSRDTGTVEINIKNGAGEEPAEKIPPRGSVSSEKLEAARRALRQIEARTSVRAARASGDNNSYAELLDDLRGIEKNADIPIKQYVPRDNQLIKSVLIRQWPSRYTFYERFRSDAEKLFDKAGTECRHIAFFSFMPQYIQLSPEQLKWYLWWRDNVRRGVYLITDYSYILLYIYEIINLPDKIRPAEGVNLLCAIWKAYRLRYPKLERCLAEWVCDYCLIHELNPPRRYYDGFLNDVIAAVSFKEFYAGFGDEASSPYISAMFAYCSNYDWRKSKYVTDENRQLFEKHIRGAFVYAFSKVEKENKSVYAPIGLKSMSAAKTLRDAFSGALCAYNMKRKIEVEYLSCSRSVELRYTVTDMIKYAENNVRAMLGIRSRFHTPNLPQPLKNAADMYFAPYRAAQKREAPVPDYDKLYDAESRGISGDYARAIEEKSWDITSRLVDESETDITADVPAAIPDEPADTSDGETGIIFEALRYIMNGDKVSLDSLAANNNIMTATLIERINEAACDVIGDIVVEETDRGSYSVISDYTEDIIKWMNK